jgi:hypothetical protein
MQRKGRSSRSEKPIANVLIKLYAMPSADCRAAVRSDAAWLSLSARFEIAMMASVRHAFTERGFSTLTTAPSHVVIML